MQYIADLLITSTLSVVASGRDGTTKESVAVWCSNCMATAPLPSLFASGHGRRATRVRPFDPKVNWQTALSLEVCVGGLRRFGHHEVVTPLVR